MGTFSIWHWLIVLVVILLVFGTRNLPNIGKDLGNAIKGFKDSMKDTKDTTSTTSDVRFITDDDKMNK